ncbi:MAG TPA: lipopolysaccharide assembly protein LapA domain-containing protein [Microlunatus sp.]|nr:lipopolysaccharide assembly protein LapA domain-containing protein [Microlunatus sp.]
MPTDPTSQRPDEPREEPSTSAATAGAREPAPRLTRTSAAWVATAATLLLLVLLSVFILQNPTRVEVSYLGFTGSLPLGVALLLAAVGGGVLVAIAAVARVTQLRVNARRTRHHRSDA